tara:strand:+ start:298 stop:786 length:489 start_codon:yes stop_codon:yes gene_type:complete
MQIINHKLIQTKCDEVNIKYQETPNTSSNFKPNLPDTIILHYTGGSSLQSSANWLCNPEAKSSAHIIIGKSGDIIQLIPFNIITWHARKSQWKERKGLNKYSIGIELDNAGILTKKENGYYTWFNNKVEDKNVLIAKHPLDNKPKKPGKHTLKNKSKPPNKS